MSLKEYRAKRRFQKTPEPAGGAGSDKGHLFVIQEHHASHLHYDFRLELGGVLKSWAVPKGPPEAPGEKRLAVEVEDHPVDYATFEGEIPKGEYGAGTVEIWDKGSWYTEGSARKQLEDGHLEFQLDGERLKGTWLLVRTAMKKDAPRATKGSKKRKSNWFLIKRSTPLKIHREPLAVKTQKLPAKSSMPKIIEPQLCAQEAKPPQGEGWVHEIKFDGYRTMARLQSKKIQLLTRSGLDWTQKYPEIAQELVKLGVQSAWIDGEICGVDDKGRSSFEALQNALENKQTTSLVYYVFDLLYWNGRDLRGLSLLQRKSMLQELIKKSKLKHLIYSEHHEEEGRVVLASAKKHGLEGIISKSAQAPYESGRSTHWVKVKSRNSEEFVITGYTLQDQPGLIGALILATFDADKNLVYTGRVGTGFTQQSSRDLLAKFKKMGAKASPFDQKIPLERDVHWVKPQLIAQVEFSNWTTQGILRQASYLGLREDKKIKDVKASNSSRLLISSAEKIVYPESGLTKGDVARYYQVAAPLMLEHLRQRPVSLFRCPDGTAGTCFFQKHLDKKPGVIRIGSEKEILDLVQLNTLEFHNTHLNAKARAPDLIVFDLDPDPEVSWRRVKQAALDLKAILDQLGLMSYLKTSGNKGLHIHVPLAPIYTWAEIEKFAKSVCHQMVLQKPDDYTLNILKKNRHNKIFLDYLRNKKDSTSVVPYSLRAKASAGTALPLRWEDLKTLKSSDQFKLEEAIQILQKRKRDPWEGYFKQKQKIKALDQLRRAKRKS